MLGAVQVQNQQCEGLIPGVIILYKNKFHPFNFTAELKAAGITPQDQQNWVLPLTQH